MKWDTNMAAMTSRENALYIYISANRSGIDGSVAENGEFGRRGRTGVLSRIGKVGIVRRKML